MTFSINDVYISTILTTQPYVCILQLFLRYHILNQRYIVEFAKLSMNISKLIVNIRPTCNQICLEFSANINYNFCFTQINKWLTCFILWFYITLQTVEELRSFPSPSSSLSLCIPFQFKTLGVRGTRLDWKVLSS